MIPHDTHLHIGSLLFEGVDQIDLTGPFEVLSRIPNATYRIYSKAGVPGRDLKGLWLMPDASLADAPPLDVLHVPGGFGQEALMEDTEVLGWIRQQASGGCHIMPWRDPRQRTCGHRRRLGLRCRRHGWH
jgi:cyclohexyl-isocyanide hydratase